METLKKDWDAGQTQPSRGDSASTAQQTTPISTLRQTIAQTTHDTLSPERRTASGKLTQTITQSISQTTGGHSMSGDQNLAHQIELLQHLKAYLGEFQERLLGVSANYQRKVDHLHDEARLMDESYRRLVEHGLEPTRSLIRQLVDHISENDIPAVEREIAYYEQGL
jgi:hypothetical protein